jgi:MoaA/NifB/PqqE/SkfB family radical SAM enzyme
MSTVEKVIQNCIETGQQYIALHHMGEPLMHEQIGNIIWKFYRAGIKTEFSTNGDLLDKKGFDVLANKVSQIRIAVDYFYKKEGYLDKIENFLQEAMNFPETKIRIHTILGNDLSRFEEYAKVGNVILENKSFDNWGGQVEGESTLTPGKECYFLEHNYVVVLWDGTVVTCCLDYDGQFVLGHINDMGHITNKSCSLCKTCAKLQFADGGGWTI